MENIQGITKSSENGMSFPNLKWPPHFVAPVVSSLCLSLNKQSFVSCFLYSVTMGKIDFYSSPPEFLTESIYLSSNNNKKMVLQKSTCCCGPLFSPYSNYRSILAISIYFLFIKKNSRSRLCFYNPISICNIWEMEKALVIGELLYSIICFPS